GAWTFTLDGCPVAGPVHLVRKMNTSGRHNKIAFGTNLLPGNYTLCEKHFGSWQSSLLTQPGGFRNLNGDACVAFALLAGQRQVVRVNNVCPASATKRNAALPKP